MVSRKTIVRFKVAENRCPICIRLNLECCYCHKIVNDQVLDATQQQLTSYSKAAYDEGYKRFDAIQKKSKVVFDVTLSTTEQNKCRIDFEPKSIKENNAYIKFLNDKLSIHLNDAEPRS
jgi:hypothetical protein